MKEGGGSVSQCLDAILIWDPQGFYYYYYRAAATGECVCRTEVRAWQCQGCALIGTARVAEPHQVSEQDWELGATRLVSRSQPERKKKHCSVFMLPFFHFPGGNQNIYRQETRKKNCKEGSRVCAKGVKGQSARTKVTHSCHCQGREERGGRSVVPLRKDESRMQMLLAAAALEMK